MIVWPAPVNVTVDPDEIREATDAVVQEPSIRIVAVLMLRLAGPADNRSPERATVAPVQMSTPDHVRFETKVVPMPGFTVRLPRGCGMLMDPPDAFTTTVEVPAVNSPAEVSIDWTVIVLPFATSTPPAETVTVAAVTARFAPEVLSVIVPGPPWIVIVRARRPETAIVNVTEEEPLLNTTASNSGLLKWVPANAIVWSELELKVTIPVPADHDPEVEVFVQLPEIVHASEPNAR